MSIGGVTYPVWFPIDKAQAIRVQGEEWSAKVVMVEALLVAVAVGKVRLIHQRTVGTLLLKPDPSALQNCTKAHRLFKMTQGTAHQIFNLNENAVAEFPNCDAALVHKRWTEVAQPSAAQA